MKLNITFINWRTRVKNEVKVAFRNAHPDTHVYGRETKVKGLDSSAGVTPNAADRQGRTIGRNVSTEAAEHAGLILVRPLLGLRPGVVVVGAG